MTPSTLHSGRRSGRFRRLTIFAAALVAAALGTASSAAAAAPPVVVKVHRASGVASPYFALPARPGRSVRAGRIELVNPHARSVVVRLDPVAGITTSTLGSAYQQQSAPLTGAARWLSVSSRRVSLAPHAHQNVQVGVQVPANAQPGDYLGGVSVEALGQNHVTRSRGVAIGQVQRYAIGVEVMLPGARRRHVSLTSAAVRRDPSGIVFQVHGRNDGNAILQGVHGRVLITRGSKRVASATVSPGTFVSGTSIDYPVGAPKEEPREGARYRVRATFYYPGGVAHLDTGVKFGHAAAVVQQQYGGPDASPAPGFPWAWVVLGLLLGSVVGYLVFVRRRNALRRARGLALLREQLADVRPSKPLSVIHVQLRAASRKVRRRVGKLLEPRMRRADSVCELDESELLLILPETDLDMAIRLACDMALRIGPEAFGSDVHWVRAATAVEETDALDLIERARQQSQLAAAGELAGV